MASPLELLLMASLTGGNAPVSPAVWWSTQTTLINSTTDAAVNNLVAPVTSGTTYLVSAVVCYVSGASAGTPVFTFHGPAVSSALLATDFLSSNAGTVTAARVLNGSIGSSATGPTLTSSDTAAYRAAGLATFSASGNLSLQAHTSAGADTFTCQVNSFISLTALPGQG